MVAAAAVLVLRDLLTFALPLAALFSLAFAPFLQLRCALALLHRSALASRTLSTLAIGAGTVQVIFPNMGRTPSHSDVRVGVVLRQGCPA